MSWAPQLLLVCAAWASERRAAVPIETAWAPAPAAAPEVPVVSRGGGVTTLAGEPAQLSLFPNLPPAEIARAEAAAPALAALETGKPPAAPAAASAEAGAAREGQAAAGGEAPAGRELFDGDARRSVSLAEPSAGQRRLRAWRDWVPLLKLFTKAPADSPLPAFDDRTAAQLRELSKVDAAEADALIAWLRRTEIPASGKLPYPEDTTFALELELLMNRQLSDADLRRLFPGDTLSPQQWNQWRQERKLPPRAWKKARRFAYAFLKRGLPEGWWITDESRSHGGWGTGGNTIELHTAARGKKYHENKPQDWADLAAGLRQVQDAIPGGLYSAHIHVSRRSMLRGRGLAWLEALRVDKRRFALVSLTFEGLWRALMGHPMDRSPNSAYLTPASLLDPRVSPEEPLHHHSSWVNLSWHLPTMENKSVTRLFRQRPDGAEYLDADSLRQDLWGAFALFDMVARADELPLASLGVPVAGGARPTRKQLLHFLDLAYGSDLPGKAIALKKLSEALEPPPPAARARQARSAEMEKAYRQLGLTVVYDLHAAHDGWDEKLAEHLLERRGKRMKRLGRDLRKARLKVAQAQALFPAELREPVARAMRRQYPVAPRDSAALPR